MAALYLRCYFEQIVHDKLHNALDGCWVEDNKLLKLRQLDLLLEEVRLYFRQSPLVLLEDLMIEAGLKRLMLLNALHFSLLDTAVLPDEQLQLLLAVYDG